MSFTFTVDPGQLQPAPRIPVTANSAPLGAMVGGILHAYRPGGGYNSIGRHLVGDEVSARRLYAPTGNAVETQGVLTLSEAEYRPTDWHDALPNSITIDPIALADLATVHHEGTVAPTVTWILASGVVGDAVRVDVRWGWVAPPVSTKLLWRVYASPDGDTLTLPELPIALTGNPTLGAPEQVVVHHLDVDDADGVTAAANARSDQSSQQSFTRQVL